MRSNLNVLKKCALYEREREKGREGGGERERERELSLFCRIVLYILSEATGFTYFPEFKISMLICLIIDEMM